MSRGIAVIGDVHLGPRKSVPVSETVILDSFKRSFECMDVLAKRQLDVFVVGDLFDAPIVSPDYVKVANDFVRRSCVNGRRFYVVAGNHDIRRSAHDTTLSALDYLTYYDNDSVTQGRPRVVGAGGLRILMIPYIMEAPMRDVIKEATDGVAKGKIDVLLSHVGVFQSHMSPPWMLEDSAYVDAAWLMDRMQLIGCKVAVVGHDHTHRSFLHTRKSGLFQIVQVGAFVPRTFAETGTSYGNVVTMNVTGKAEVRVEVQENFAHGLRFFDVYDQGVEQDCSEHDVIVARRNDTTDNTVIEAPYVDTVEASDVTLWPGGVVTPEAAVRAYVGNSGTNSPGMVLEAVARLSCGTVPGCVPIRPRRWYERC